MSNQDLDWLSAQQPQRIEPDHAARERARRALVRHTTSHTRRRRLNLGSGLRARIAASTGVAAAAAGIAAAVVLSSGGGSVAGLGKLSHPVQAPRTATHHHGSARSPLVRLADFVSNSATPPGNATLVARTTHLNGQTVTVYDLYADNGEYFFSQTENGLAGQVSANNNQGAGLFAREVAAAKLAATGDVQTAAQDMADAAVPNQAGNPTPGDSLYNNWAWANSQDALIAGSGQPQVRAGVLQILATLPGVTVTQGTSGGQPTLVLTAGADEFGAHYTEQLTIDADTGTPIRFVGGASVATPDTVVDYDVSRVTFAHLPTGTGSGA